VQVADPAGGRHAPRAPFGVHGEMIATVQVLASLRRHGARRRTTHDVSWIGTASSVMVRHVRATYRGMRLSLYG
jgi:hypothetical protein